MQFVETEFFVYRKPVEHDLKRIVDESSNSYIT